MPAPLYEPQARAPQAQGFQGAPLPLPQLPGGEVVGQAVQRLATTVTAFAAHLQEAQDETKANLGKTKFLETLRPKEEAALRSQDFANAPGEFSQAAKAAQAEALTGIASPQRRAALDLWLTGHRASAEGRVGKVQLANQNDANAAALDRQEQAALQDIGTAGSAIERAAILGRMRSSWSGAADAGWITQQNAAARDKHFAYLKASQEAMQNTAGDPQRALERYKDPNFVPELDPVTREGFRIQAQHAADQNTLDKLAVQTRERPEAVSLGFGRMLDPRHAAPIFNAIIQVESHGNPNAQSGAGAAGIAQIMPGTARDVAGGLGVKAFDGLDDAGVRAKLKADPDLSRGLGLAYFREGLARYGNSIPAALAFYNAGPGNSKKPGADDWHKAAVEQFGPNYSAAQFASIVTFPETKAYVGKVYGAAGVDPGGVALSPHGYYRALNTVAHEAAAEERRGARLATALAASDRRDDALGIAKAGLPLAPERLTQTLAVQDAAAARGDQAAAQNARDLREQLALKPAIDEAYAQPPAAAAARLAALEATARAGTDTSPTFFRALNSYRAVVAEIESKKNSEPVALLERAYPQLGTIAIDPRAAPDDPGFQEALARRSEQAQTARSIYLGSAAPFKASELGPLKERFTTAAPADQARLLASMAKAMAPEVYRAGAGQIAGDRPAALQAGLVMAEGGSAEAARDALEGLRLRATRGAQAPLPDKLGFPGAIKETYGAAYLLHPEDGARATAMARAIAITRMERAGIDPKDSEAAAIYNRALQEAAGAVFVDGVQYGGTTAYRPNWRSYRTVVPAGLRADSFRDAVRAIRDEDLAALPNPPTDGEGKPYRASALHGAVPVRAADGYRFAQGEPNSDDPKYIRGAGGAPFVLDFAALEGQLRARLPGAFLPGASREPR